MSSAFPPTDEGDEAHGSVLSKPIRLSEVPLIAERVEGGVDGALKEAFALRSLDEARAVEPAVIDRAEVEAAHAEAESVAAAPTSVPADLPDVTLAEPQHHAASVATKLADEKPAESAAEIESAAAVVRDVRAETPAELGPAVSHDRDEVSPLAIPPSVAEARETQAPLAHDSVETERSPVISLSGADESGFTPEPSERSGDTTPPLPPIAPPLFHAEPVTRPFAESGARVFPLQQDEAREHPNLSFNSPGPAEHVADRWEMPATQRPLAGALDTAAKLAADANAAAEALENLKRLLDRELPNTAQAPRQPLHEVFAEAPSPHEPPPLPEHELQEDSVYDEQPAPGPLPLPRANVRWRERRQFDVRGFLAGFALSWAIGAVLYIYLTAG